jgi:sugar lactone lactonase YvrE
VSSNGVVTTFINSDTGQAGFGSNVVLTGIDSDLSGNLYIASGFEHKILKINKSRGTVAVFAGTGVAGFKDGNASEAMFFNPADLAVDKSTGDVYVSDASNHVIRKITSAGIVSTVAGQPQVNGIKNGPPTVALFNRPAGICLDSNGNIYVADSYNHQIRKIEPLFRNVGTIAGSGVLGFKDDSIATRAMFNYPSGVAVSINNKIYVADTANHKIRVISSETSVETFAGSTKGFANGAASIAKFDSPGDIIADKDGSVYVVDGNCLIRQILPSGIVGTLAGTNPVGTTKYCGYADGAASTARFMKPNCLTIVETNT